MTPKLQTILQHLKQELTALYNNRLIHLTLFGSQARGAISKAISGGVLKRKSIFPRSRA